MVRDRVGGVPLHAIEATCFVHTGIAQALDEASQPWGIRVFRYEIADIHVDRGTREAMEKQSNAERLRRAEVLESEAVWKSKFTVRSRPSSTPSARRLLDGVAMPVPHRSTEPARPRRTG